MMTTSFKAPVLSGLIAAILALSAFAAETGLPGIPDEVADLMSQTQLRHFKLGYAGEVGNWDLAAYESRQIRRTFDKAGAMGGVINGKPLALWFEEESLPPLTAIDKAIAEKSTSKFNLAFGTLTKACNACHRSAKIEFIRLQVPTASPFSNQAFPP